MTSDNNLHKHGKAMILLIIVMITKIVRITTNRCSADADGYIQKPGNAVNTGMIFSGLQKCRHSSWNDFSLGLNGLSIGQEHM